LYDKIAYVIVTSVPREFSL